MSVQAAHRTLVWVDRKGQERAIAAPVRAYALARISPDETRGDRKVETLVASPSMEFGAEISPDGRWFAYHSNESGEFEVYVRPFPNVHEGRLQISTAGGTRAAWARSGHHSSEATRQREWLSFSTGSQKSKDGCRPDSASFFQFDDGCPATALVVGGGVILFDLRMRFQERRDALAQLAGAVTVHDADFVKVGDQRIVEES